MKTGRKNRLLFILSGVQMACCAAFGFQVIYQFIRFPSLPLGGEHYLLTLSLIFFLSASIYLTWLLQTRYPDHEITQRVEGFLYLVSFLAGAAALFVIAVGLAYILVDLPTDNPLGLQLMWNFRWQAITLFLLSSFQMLIIYASFKLMAVIRKNYAHRLREQIQSLGT